MERFPVLALVCLFVLISWSGCMVLEQPAPEKQTDITIPDPETGVVAWIDAVNRKDVGELYLLAPSSIRKQVSYEDFVVVNKNTTFLQPGYEFTGYTLQNKSENRTCATITAWLVLHKPANIPSSEPGDIPLFFTFNLVYEDGRWRVWA